MDKLAKLPCWTTPQALPSLQLSVLNFFSGQDKFPELGRALLHSLHKFHPQRHRSLAFFLSDLLQNNESTVSADIVVEDMMLRVYTVLSQTNEHKNNKVQVNNQTSENSPNKSTSVSHTIPLTEVKNIDLTPKFLNSTTSNCEDNDRSIDLVHTQMLDNFSNMETSIQSYKSLNNHDENKTQSSQNYINNNSDQIESSLVSLPRTEQLRTISLEIPTLNNIQETTKHLINSSCPIEFEKSKTYNSLIGNKEFSNNKSNVTDHESVARNNVNSCSNNFNNTNGNIIFNIDKKSEHNINFNLPKSSSENLLPDNFELSFNTEVCIDDETSLKLPRTFDTSTNNTNIPPEDQNISLISIPDEIMSPNQYNKSLKPEISISSKENSSSIGDETNFIDLKNPFYDMNSLIHDPLRNEYSFDSNNRDNCNETATAYITPKSMSNYNNCDSLDNKNYNSNTNPVGNSVVSNISIRNIRSRPKNILDKTFFIRTTRNRPASISKIKNRRIYYLKSKLKYKKNLTQILNNKIFNESTQNNIKFAGDSTEVYIIKDTNDSIPNYKQESSNKTSLECSGDNILSESEEISTEISLGLKKFLILSKKEEYCDSKGEQIIENDVELYNYDLEEYSPYSIIALFEDLLSPTFATALKNSRFKNKFIQQIRHDLLPYISLELKNTFTRLFTPDSSAIALEFDNIYNNLLKWFRNLPLLPSTPDALLTLLKQAIVQLHTSNQNSAKKVIDNISVGIPDDIDYFNSPSGHQFWFLLAIIVKSLSPGGILEWIVAALPEFRTIVTDLTKFFPLICDDNEVNQSHSNSHQIHEKQNTPTTEINNLAYKLTLINKLAYVFEETSEKYSNTIIQQIICCEHRGRILKDRLSSIFLDSPNPTATVPLMGSRTVFNSTIEQFLVDYPTETTEIPSWFQWVPYPGSVTLHTVKTLLRSFAPTFILSAEGESISYASPALANVLSGVRINSIPEVNSQMNDRLTRFKERKAAALLSQTMNQSNTQTKPESTVHAVHEKKWQAWNFELLDLPEPEETTSNDWVETAIPEVTLEQDNITVQTEINDTDKESREPLKLTLNFSNPIQKRARTINDENTKRLTESSGSQKQILESKTNIINIIKQKLKSTEIKKTTEKTSIDPISSDDALFKGRSVKPRQNRDPSPVITPPKNYPSNPSSLNNSPRNKRNSSIQTPPLSPRKHQEDEMPTIIEVNPLHNAAFATTHGAYAGLATAGSRKPLTSQIPRSMLATFRKLQSSLPRGSGFHPTGHSRPSAESVADVLMFEAITTVSSDLPGILAYSRIADKVYRICDIKLFTRISSDQQLMVTRLGTHDVTQPVLECLIRHVLPVAAQYYGEGNIVFFALNEPSQYDGSKNQSNISNTKKQMTRIPEQISTLRRMMLLPSQHGAKYYYIPFLEKLINLLVNHVHNFRTRFSKITVTEYKEGVMPFETSFIPISRLILLLIEYETELFSAPGVATTIPELAKDTIDPANVRLTTEQAKRLYADLRLTFKKEKMCPNLAMGCSRQAHCGFAHSAAEMNQVNQPKTKLPSKTYMTKLCTEFSNTGRCLLCPNCEDAHDINDILDEGVRRADVADKLAILSAWYNAQQAKARKAKITSALATFLKVDWVTSNSASQFVNHNAGKKLLKHFGLDDEEGIEIVNGILTGNISSDLSIPIEDLKSGEAARIIYSGREQKAITSVVNQRVVPNSTWTEDTPMKILDMPKEHLLYTLDIKNYSSL